MQPQRQSTLSSNIIILTQMKMFTLRLCVLQSSHPRALTQVLFGVLLTPAPSELALFSLAATPLRKRSANSGLHSSVGSVGLWHLFTTVNCFHNRGLTDVSDAKRALFFFPAFLDISCTVISNKRKTLSNQEGFCVILLLPLVQEEKCHNYSVESHKKNYDL